MCLGTNMCGHKRVWAQTSVGTNVCGHNRLWAQMCEGTNVCGHNRVWAQTCVGTIVCTGTIVWAQICMGTNVWSPNVVNPLVTELCFSVIFEMYLEKNSYRLVTSHIGATLVRFFFNYPYLFWNHKFDQAFPFCEHWSLKG